MPIHTPTAPQAALDALQSGLGQLRATGGPKFLVALTTGHAAPLAQGLPHQSYNLGLDAVQAGRGLEAAQPTSWRFLLGEPSQAPTVDAEVRAAAGTQTLAGLNYGPFVAQTFNALQAASSHPDVASGTFELRLLRVPALHVVAVWLKDTTGSGDIVIPLAPAPAGLTAGRHYSAAELGAALATLAKTIGAAPPKGPTGGPHAP